MADFTTAFKLTMKSEGLYVHDPDDPGGETYKGIARSRNSKWQGWVIIDMLKTKSNFPKNLNDDVELQVQIEMFYEANYWDKVQGDLITNQDIAESIFDFAVNAGVRTSARLAQIVVNAEPDGVIGGVTVARINAISPQLFISSFALAKISRYVHICEKRPASRKYFFGWIRRTLEGL